MCVLIWKMSLMRTAPGQEDQELLADKTFIRFTNLHNHKSIAPQMPHRVQVIYTPQHQLLKGDCMKQAFMFKLLQKQLPLLRKNKTNNCWGQKTKWMDIRPLEICTLVQWVQILVLPTTFLWDAEKLEVRDRAGPSQCGAPSEISYGAPLHLRFKYIYIYFFFKSHLIALFLS